MSAPTSAFAVSMRALAEAIFQAPEGPPPAERLDWVTGEALDVYRRADGGIRFVLRLAMFAVSLIAPLYVGRLSLMRRLPLELRIRALGRLERGFLSGPLLLLKVILCLAYYEHPDVEREVGVTGFGKVGLKRAANA